MRKPYPRGRGPPDKSKSSEGETLSGRDQSARTIRSKEGPGQLSPVREEETQARVGDVQLIKPAVKQLRGVKYFSRFTILRGP